MITMKQISLFLIAAAVAAGCSKSEAPPPSTATATRELRFAVIPKALDIPVFNYARIGAERAAAELGNIRVEWRAPDSADQLRQKEILESFITQRVDGIAISALNGDFLTETINRAIDAGRRVIAVGTTTTRTLESVAAANGGRLVPGRGDTDLFIYPGFTFRIVSGLMTNFHLPQSSLLMLVCALGGTAPVLAAYRTAVAERYRFYSYGDAMLVL